MLNQGELEHAGPRPQLADREGCDGLIGVDEPVQPVTIESRVAIAEQLDGHGVDACRAGELARGQLRKLSVVARWKVMADLTHLAFHQVEVVEQPLGGGRRRLAAFGVLGKRGIDAPQCLLVLAESLQVGAAAAALAQRDGEERGQPSRMLLEGFNSQELDIARGRPREAGVIHRAATLGFVCTAQCV